MGPERFLADAMLGRLARWLRVLGYDTFFDATLPDPALVRIADAEDRVLLTRDRHLLRELRPRRSLEIREDKPLAQLRQVVEAFQLAVPVALFTRCIVCNGLLSAPLSAEEAKPLLPHDPAGIEGPVRRCLSCGKVYWEGSHTRRMRAALDASFPRGGDDAVRSPAPSAPAPSSR